MNKWKNYDGACSCWTLKNNYIFYLFSFITKKMTHFDGLPWDDADGVHHRGPKNTACGGADVREGRGEESGVGGL